ncbi:MAG: DUF5060 domain-containing protein [Armatimonadetes bacterium]|nr:DUF5060 domain-containing protein [Armatimonadota bacterium]
MSASSVEQWDVFELALEGPRDGNPSVDVSLQGEFRQGERVLRPEGFYDGDGIYRLRLMPGEPGE